MKAFLFILFIYSLIRECYFCACGTSAEQLYWDVKGKGNMNPIIWEI
jgi:hypothetical protein